MSEVDIFIGNHTIIDPESYQLWIDGYSVEEALLVLHQREPSAPKDLLTSEVDDHFRCYSLLEPLIQRPPCLGEQLTFQIVANSRKHIVEKYYSLDDVVARELLGKKLSSKQRKDLDEVSEKVGVSLRSCRRQFDNIKRIFKTVEEMSGSAVTNIKTHYLLSTDLAKKYAAIVFIASNRFETGKRKLHYLTFSDFYHCSLLIMAQWTCKGSPNFNPLNVSQADSSGGCSEDIDLDKDFLLQLRELKVLVDREKEHKHLVCQRLRPLVREQTHRELESNFKSYSRTLLTLAACLNHGRDMRDLFLDLVEKFVDPCRHLQWSSSDLTHFLQTYTSTAADLDVLRDDADLRSAWERYMNVVAGCIVIMCHN